MTSGVVEYRLPNGLHLLGEPRADAASASVGFFVRTGSRDEAPKEAGISHFLEHMLFKGTDKRDALAITFEMGNIGAQANAFTSEENTVYYASVLPEYFTQMFELLADMMRPSIPADEFDTEKKVILEEIALYQDRPHFYLFEKALRDYFAEHSAGNSVLGTTASVSEISRDEMKAYFDRRYVASNICLVATGKFDWQKLTIDAERLCGSWPRGEAKRLITQFSASTFKREYRKRGLAQAHLLWLTPGPSLQDEERYAMTLLAMMLGDGTGSRLYWELVDSGIAETASVDCDERDGTGVVSTFVTTEPGRVDETVELVANVLSMKEKFSADELERAKMKCVSRVVLNGELPMGRLMSLGIEWNSRQRVDLLRETIERLRSVSLLDVMRTLERFSLRDWAQFQLLPE